MAENVKKETFSTQFLDCEHLTELFERGAYYAMASFVVLYLGQLGLGDYWPSTLNGFLWTLVYFLPILIRERSLIISDSKNLFSALLSSLQSDTFFMGYPVWFGGEALSLTVESEITAGLSIILPVVLAIFLIGLGGSVIKPCISGTIQKTSGKRATLAFGIFYMIINVGSLFGRGISYFTRTQFSDLSLIFAVSVACSIIAFIVVLFFYTDSEKEPGYESSQKGEKIGKTDPDRYGFGPEK